MSESHIGTRYGSNLYQIDEHCQPSLAQAQVAAEAEPSIVQNALGNSGLGYSAATQGSVFGP